MYIIMKMMIIIRIKIIIYCNNISVGNTGLYLAQNYSDEVGICVTGFRITEGSLQLNNVKFKNIW
jgi:hypothetical protein